MLGLWLGGPGRSRWLSPGPLSSAHGALEFPAIFLAGAAGFAIARGQLLPGALPRGKAIAQGGRTAIRLLVGAGVLFLVAAVVEAWFSPEPFAFVWKVVAALVLFIGLVAWLAAPAREPDSPQKLEVS